jgi:hypothetical protein
MASAGSGYRPNGSAGAGPSVRARCIAKRIKSGKLKGPVEYAMPTPRLGEDIAEQFREHGITAEVWRGRNALVSGRGGPRMCDDLAAVKLAEKARMPVEESCCKGKRPDGMPAVCPSYATCAYQRQKKQRPDVWIFAHQLLFQK